MTPTPRSPPALRRSAVVAVFEAVAFTCMLLTSLPTLARAHTSDPRASESPSAVAWPEQAADENERQGKAVSLEVRPKGEATSSNDEPKEAPVKPQQDRVPPPRPAMREQVSVAVGLSPEAPGSKQEIALLDRLASSAAASPRTPAHVRRLRPGAGDARRICRERRDDLVIMIGYLPERDDPVVLAHDCRLDVPLGVRAIGAVEEPGLVGALWDEHDELVRQGHTERRRLMRIGPRARAGIIGGVAVVVVGVAVGLLVANALRGERVVLRVRP